MIVSLQASHVESLLAIRLAGIWLPGDRNRHVAPDKKLTRPGILWCPHPDRQVPVPARPDSKRHPAVSSGKHRFCFTRGKPGDRPTHYAIVSSKKTTSRAAAILTFRGMHMTTMTKNMALVICLLTTGAIGQTLTQNLPQETPMPGPGANTKPSGKAALCESLAQKLSALDVMAKQTQNAEKQASISDEKKRGQAARSEMKC
ncbi:MAG: hypothetical protein V4632_16855 [Pseudomonadota bacterium]